MDQILTKALAVLKFIPPVMHSGEQFAMTTGTFSMLEWFVDSWAVQMLFKHCKDQRFLTELEELDWMMYVAMDRNRSYLIVHIVAGAFTIAGIMKMLVLNAVFVSQVN